MFPSGGEITGAFTAVHEDCVSRKNTESVDASEFPGSVANMSYRVREASMRIKYFQKASVADDESLRRHALHFCGCADLPVGRLLLAAEVNEN